ncbi:hypothetical protein E2C01_012469 [Portunus trituberculatus]|uniref:Uncharacterized protein n=1 Tax=Portunus trituberculatus TaxID=210409 RepID=A0A5B7DDQ8_PORTR|nr:hypothetical protein [Portunus trituberculatus]
MEEIKESCCKGYISNLPVRLQKAYRGEFLKERELLHCNLSQLHVFLQLPRATLLLLLRLGHLDMTVHISCSRVLPHVLLNVAVLGLVV